MGIWVNSDSRIVQIHQQHPTLVDADVYKPSIGYEVDLFICRHHLYVHFICICIQSCNSFLPNTEYAHPSDCCERPGRLAMQIRNFGITVVYHHAFSARLLSLLFGNVHGTVQITFAQVSRVPSLQAHSIHDIPLLRYMPRNTQ